MRICSQIKNRTSVAGISNAYKPKKENVKKLKIYLNKIKNES
jgi:tRNA-binding EMAP/Myf-like protein